MARRGNNNKPHLLSEATVKKFMKLSGLESHSTNFRKDMGYNNNTREQYWEQPGLSQYRSRLHEEMEGNVSQDPDKAIGPGAQDQLSEEEEMGMDAAAPAADAAPAGDMEAKVEDIVTAIADAIETAVPEVSVDVEAGGEAAPAADAAPAPAADAAPAGEPAMGDEGDDEAAMMKNLQETIRGAIREAFRMREEMEGNVSQDPDKAIGPGAQDQLSEEEEKAEGDAPEVEAVVDAIVDAIESATDMEVEAEPADEPAEEKADDEEAALKGRKMEAMDKEDDEEAALKQMKEALKNRKTAKRLVENVMRRARKQASRSGRSRRRR